MGKAKTGNPGDHGTALPRPSRLYTAFWAALIVLLLLGVHFVNPVQRGLWMQVFFNSLHVPVFGVIGVAVFMLAGSYGELSLPRRLLVALGAVAIIGVASEAAQIPGTRDASLQDLIADWLGAVSFVLLATAVQIYRDDNRIRSFTFALAGVALLVFALAELAGTSMAYVERRLRLPALAGVDWYLGDRFMRLQNANIEITPVAAGRGSRARVSLRRSAWPGIEFHDIWPDWSAYTTLVVDVEPIGDAPLQLNIRAHDRQHRQGDQAYSDRFNRRLTLAPESGTVRIPLTEIASAPKNRRMDLTQMDSMMLFGSKEAQGREFWLSEIRLE